MCEQRLPIDHCSTCPTNDDNNALLESLKVFSGDLPSASIDDVPLFPNLIDASVTNTLAFPCPTSNTNSSGIGSFGNGDAHEDIQNRGNIIDTGPISSPLRQSQINDSSLDNMERLFNASNNNHNLITGFSNYESLSIDTTNAIVIPNISANSPKALMSSSINIASTANTIMTISPESLGKNPFSTAENSQSAAILTPQLEVLADIEKQKAEITETLQEIAETCSATTNLEEQESEKIIRDVQRIQTLVEQQVEKIEQILTPKPDITDPSEATSLPPLLIDTSNCNSNSIGLGMNMGSQRRMSSASDLNELSKEELIKRCIDYEQQIIEYEDVIEPMAMITTNTSPSVASTLNRMSFELVRCQWSGCTAVVESPEALRNHLVDAHISQQDSFICYWENCTRLRQPFTRKSRIVSHLNTHTGEKKYKCPIDGCVKKFNRRDALNMHIKTHTNLKPYKCSFKGCNRSYYHSRSHKRHEKSHLRHSLPNSPAQSSDMADDNLLDDEEESSAELL